MQACGDDGHNHLPRGTILEHGVELPRKDLSTKPREVVGTEGADGYSGSMVAGIRKGLETTRSWW